MAAQVAQPLNFGPQGGQQARRRRATFFQKKMTDSEKKLQTLYDFAIWGKKLIKKWLDLGIAASETASVFRKTHAAREEAVHHFFLKIRRFEKNPQNPYQI